MAPTLAPSSPPHSLDGGGSEEQRGGAQGFKGRPRQRPQEGESRTAWHVDSQPWRRAWWSGAAARVKAEVGRGWKTPRSERDYGRRPAPEPNVPTLSRNLELGRLRAEARDASDEEWVTTGGGFLEW